MESGGGGQTGFWQKLKKGKLKMANEKLKMAGAEGWFVFGDTCSFSLRLLVVASSCSE